MVIVAWDGWNVGHISKHHVTQTEAEFVLRTARDPWPAEKGDGKFVVWGPTVSGRLLQVIFTLKFPDEIEFEALTIDQWADVREDDRIVYVVHAMELTSKMKRQFRRRRKKP